MSRQPAESRPTEPTQAEVKIHEQMGKEVSGLMRRFKSFLKENPPYQRAAANESLYPRNEGYHSGVLTPWALSRLRSDVTFPRAEGSTRVISIVDDDSENYDLRQSPYTYAISLRIVDQQPGTSTQVTLIGLLGKNDLSRFDEQTDDFDHGIIDYKRITQSNTSKEEIKKEGPDALGEVNKYFQGFTALPQTDQAQQTQK